LNEAQAMDKMTDTRLVRQLQLSSRICTYLVAAIALIALSGWVLDETQLSNFGSGAIPMAVATTFCFLFCAFAVHGLSFTKPKHSLHERAQNGLAAIVGLVAVYILLTYALNLPNRGEILGAAFGRVAALTAVCFLLLSLAVLLIDRAKGEISSGLTVIGLVISGLDLVGYTFGIEELQRVIPFSAMALPTALAFVILFFALLFARPYRGWIRYAVRGDRVGTIFRVLLPATIAIPFLFSFVMMMAIRADWFGPGFALATLSIGITFVLAALLCFLVSRVSHVATALQQAETGLYQNAKHLEAALEIAKLGAWVADVPLLATGRFDISSGAYRIFGFDEKKFDGTMRSLLDVIHPDDLNAAVSYGIEAPQRDGNHTLSFRVVRPDGSLRWIEQQARVLHDASGKPVQMMGIVQDVTEQRLVAQQLVQAQKMDAIGNLTGGLAHDFNNLLGVVIGNLDMLKIQLTDHPKLTELLDDALEASTRGADLTRRLLAFARRQPLQPALTEPNELVSGIVKLLSRILGESIEISLDLAPDTAPVSVDPVQLEASITNLANNARDAMPKGGRLIIATGNRYLDGDYVSIHPEVTPGPYVMIEVSDNGSGMPPDILSHVFEPFFTTKELGKGTGLGLSMVFGFVKQSGGHINVYSEPGVGTTFRLYLPYADGLEIANHGVSAPTDAAGGNEVILVVEDNAAMRRVVVRQLTDMGYRVVETDNGAAARAILETKKIDLLFTDVVMPGDLDGLELARIALKSIGYPKHPG